MSEPRDPSSDVATSDLTRRSLLRRAGLVAGAAAVGLPAAAQALPSPVAGSRTVPGAAGHLLLQLARVWPTDATRQLIGELDDTHTGWDDGSLELLLWPGDRARLDAAGARYEITVPDVIARDALAAPTAARVSTPQPGERTAYRTLTDVEADLRDLVRRFPTTARLVTLPNKTHEGRTVLGIEIGRDVAVEDGRPVFYMDGVHHAREWPAGEYPMMFAFDLLESDGTDARVTRLVDDVRIIIIPVMNVDGFHHSRTATPDVSGAGNPLTGNAYWRKNRRNDGGPAEGLKPGFHAYGVDPNRNYAYGWGGDGSSASTTSDTYRGPAPLSEPETRNVDWVLSRNHAHAMITNHTSGRLVLWAWSWSTETLAEQELVEGLGRGMASLNGYKGQRSIDLYIHTGVCVDHAYGTYSSISYTFEHETSFHPAYLPTIPDGYAKNRPAFLLLVEEACLLPERRLPGRAGVPAALEGRLNHGVLTGRLVDASGAPVAGTLRLTKALDIELWKNGSGANPVGKASVPGLVDTVIPTRPDGTFTWHVNPSTGHDARLAGRTDAYVLTASGPAGTVTLPVVVDRERLDLGDLTLG